MTSGSEPNADTGRPGSARRSFRIALRIPWIADTAGLAVFGVALAIRFAVDPVLPPGFPFLTFFPAVIVTTYFCGSRAGSSCAALSGLAAWYFFMSPKHSFGLDGQVALALAFYVFVFGVDIVLIRAAFHAGERLESERRVTERLYERQRVMFQELQHRVANNMQFVAGLLSLQKRKVERDPAVAVAAIGEAEQRLATFSRLHRHLYDPSLVDAPVGDTLRALCMELLQASGAAEIALRVEAVPAHLELDRLTTLSLLVVEVVTNALKHAFPGGRGTITLRLEIPQPGRLRLTVADDGGGLPECFDPAASRSLGFRIVQNLAAQLSATISIVDDGGTSVRLEFPVG